MKKSIGVKIGAMIFSSIFVGLFCTPSISAEKCKNCKEKGFANPAFPPTEEGAIAFCNKLKADLQDTTLNNIEDSTSKRLELLDKTRDIWEHLPLSTLQIYEQHLLPILTEVAHNDLYPSIRSKALGNIFFFRTIPPKPRLAVFTDALDDRDFNVRAGAACLILNESKLDSVVPEPRALEIVRDLAIGKGRMQWNMKGLYSKAQHEKDSGIVDLIKDGFQRSARSALDAYGISSLNLLDSVSKYGETEELRKSAKRGAMLM